MKRPLTESPSSGERDTIQEEDKCWKCQGHGKKRGKDSHKNQKRPAGMQFTGPTCPVCQGSGKRAASKRSQELATEPGKIIQLRGRDGKFVGTRAKGNPSQEVVGTGEILAALGCGDWRIFQLANGHKLTVDDFLCAWYAVDEMRRRGYGVTSGMYGQIVGSSNENDIKTFHHADIGCGCGSVLMTLAWAFPNSIKSHGVEAQRVSYELCKRGLAFNLGQDGSRSQHKVQLTECDLRNWDGGPLKPYDLVTGTPPYFPTERFVASQNHAQKIRCRMPTRGAASDYVAAAAGLVKTNGVICIAETARKEGEEGMLQAIKQHKLIVIRRLDVITRTGLPPRFSCWLISKPESNHNFDHEPRKFKIESMTIRTQDQNRTLEYVEALESMGWVDFECTRDKLQQANLT